MFEFQFQFFVYLENTIDWPNCLVWKLSGNFQPLHNTALHWWRKISGKRRFQCVMGDGREWNLIELPLIKTDPVFAVTSNSPQSKINPKEYNWFYSILSKLTQISSKILIYNTFVKYWILNTFNVLVHRFIIREIGGSSMTFFRALFCNLPAELTVTDLEIPEIKWDIFQKATKRSTMWDLCTIDWPKEDAANFESQNFEGP